jgi:hypothetical protein
MPGMPEMMIESSSENIPIGRLADCHKIRKNNS